MQERELTVPGRLDQIEKVCSLVGEAARGAGFGSRQAYACQLAVTEACENIIKHGYGREDAGDIHAIVRSQPGELTVELLDSAPPFNPAARPPDRTWTEQDPPVGGLGLVIIHRVMDEVKYRRKGRQNRLFLRKRLPSPAE
jgi:anti-sigma regulatory factor (Ser/Thr protein kinase)